MRCAYRAGRQLYEVEVARTPGLSVKPDVFSAVVGDQLLHFDVLRSGPGETCLMIEGRPATIYWAVDGARRWISVHGKTFVLEAPAIAGKRTHGEVSAAENELRAPMPGQVRAVQVEQGAEVRRGQTIILLEAMKLELRIQAPHAGRVARVLVQPGDAVERDQVLVEMV